MNEIHNIRVSQSTIRAAYHQLQYELQGIQRKLGSQSDDFWKAHDLMEDCSVMEELFERMMGEPLIDKVEEFIRAHK